MKPVSQKLKIAKVRWYKIWVILGSLKKERTQRTKKESLWPSLDFLILTEFKSAIWILMLVVYLVKNQKMMSMMMTPI